MKSKRLKLSYLLLFGLCLNGLYAQQVIPASGGNVSGAAGSVSYSVGQVVSAANTGTTGSVTPGVQQPYEISVLMGLNEVGITLNCDVYPNPATDFLKLKVDESAILKISSISYQLSDINGRILENKKVTSNETNIVMSHFVAGTYFLTVIQGNAEIKSFKVIKN
jgi:hypothetical protein